ncbi:RING-H2 finger protein ATL14-like [Asparagus officinalis]|uniref:RING-H2 finger protein ATL14-like n=1 Tax=Asparagus officinalis TaxID=4686 RepID=UPI00098E457B|nr:RING-H2 finger protein ATL14-like [Asparagus officinalis]
MGASLLAIATQLMVISIIIASIILFIGIGVLVLLHICIVGKAFRRGLNTISQGEELKNEGNNGLSPDDLEKLPCYDFDGGEKDCAVCLESFRNGEKCRLLPTCRHSFHAQCVDYWLVKTPICPICRTRACEKEGGQKRLEDGAVVIGFQVSS